MRGERMGKGRRFAYSEAGPVGDSVYEVAVFFEVRCLFAVVGRWVGGGTMWWC